MKKNILLMISAAITILGLAVNVYANDQANQGNNGINVNKINYTETPVNKLARGLINTATCWAEVPAGVFKVSKEKDPFTGLTLGTAEGLCNSLLRGLTGVYDTVTFIIPPYNKPIMNPEYALSSADQAMEEAMNNCSQ